MIVAILNDLIFISKIKETALQLNKKIIFIRNYNELNDFLVKNEKLNYENINLFIIDLNFIDIKPLETIQKIKNLEELKNKKIIGFCSHVQVELIQKGKKLGIEVMPRSLFSKKLVDLLNSHY